MTDDLSKSKVLSVESTVEGAVNELAAIAALGGGNKRAAGSLAGGRYNKLARIQEYELLPEDDQGQMKWRGDPADTFADWVIEVFSEGPVPTSASVGVGTPATKGSSNILVSPSPGMAEMKEEEVEVVAPPAAAATTPATQDTIEIQSQTQIYHVHRYFLGYGSRRSNYFAKLFKDSGTTTNNKTRLELEPLAAQAFPELLDFLYDPRSPLIMETETVTALHHLGVQLEMTHLQHYAKEFCAQDLSLNNLELYHEHAKLFHDDTIMNIIVQFIGKNISEISASSNFVKHQTNATLWKQALEHVSLSSLSYSTDLHLSKLITEFALANKDILDAMTFGELVHESKIRKVDPEVALTLCQLDDDFTSRQHDDEQQQQTLSSIQQRCAAALAEVWKELDPLDELVQNRKSSFLVHLLTKCLHEAKTENEKLAGGRGTASRPLRHAAALHRADRVDSMITSSSTKTPLRRPTRGSH